MIRRAEFELNLNFLSVILFVLRGRISHRLSGKKFFEEDDRSLERGDVEGESGDTGTVGTSMGREVGSRRYSREDGLAIERCLCDWWRFSTIVAS